MSTFRLNVEIDPVSLVKFARMQDSESAFKGQVQYALGRSADDIQVAATVYMWDNFTDPTGQIEDAWAQGSLAWNQVYLDNTEPYARRRNWGFSGHTDALGRYYPDDPGIAWAENAIEIATPGIEDIFDEELNGIWR